MVKGKGDEENEKKKCQQTREEDAFIPAIVGCLVAAASTVQRRVRADI